MSKPDASAPRSPWWWVPSLYLAMGLPYNIAQFVSQQYFKSRAIDVPTITFWVGLLGLTWSFKPLWSPLLEMAREKKRIVIWSQAGLAVLFGALALVVPLAGWFPASIALLWLFAFVSATQDIAADGVYVTTLDRRTMTRFSGIQSAAWTGGKVLAMGGLVYLAGRLERSMGVLGAWASVFVLMAAVMLAAALYHARVLPKGSPRTIQVQSLPEAAAVFVGIIKDFFKKPRIGWMIAFIVLYRVSESQVSAIAQLFLRDARENGGLGLSTEQVGLFYGTSASLGLVAGSLVGGKLIARYTLERSLRYLVLVFNIPILLFAYLAWAGTANLWVVGGCTTLEQFCVGMGMIACINYMMQQLAPGRFAMAHYGFGTALMNLGVSVPAMASGKIAVTLGYPTFFVYALIIAVPSVLVAFLVPFPRAPEETGPSD